MEKVVLLPWSSNVEVYEKVDYNLDEQWIDPYSVHPVLIEIFVSKLLVLSLTSDS